MRRIAALTMIVCVGVLAPARADEPDEDIPIKGQPREDFYNAKGIGENPVGPVAPAIANAVADAVGVRLKDLPITAEKVYRALVGIESLQESV